jgi:hypothetical protein
LKSVKTMTEASNAVFRTLITVEERSWNSCESVNQEYNICPPPIPMKAMPGMYPSNPYLPY